MPHELVTSLGVDSAARALSMIAQLHQISINRETLTDALDASSGAPGCSMLVRAARRIGMRASALRVDWKRLLKSPLPAIARQRDGRFVIVAKVVDGDKLLVQDPLETRPLLLPREVFERAFSGELILCRPPRGADGSMSFGFRWFLPAMVRYRKHVAEVIVASLFVQLLVLATPIFFQVVIDKVLVHRGLTTLDVLAIALLGIAVFEVILTTLRGYVLSHTTNRIDVELGAKLFRHLLRLPLAYFRARRVGDSVARVRELETLRGFLTGSALTLVVDLLFTSVILVVLVIYSGTLASIVLAAIPCYLVLSLLVTPILRARLDEKFTRGAENQAFLVEAVTGIETVKSMAVEPTMQGRWEDQLAGYVKSAFRAQHLGNLAAQLASLISKITVVLILWIGAHLVMAGELTVGQLVAFNMLAARVNAPVLRLVQLWQDFQQAAISLRRLGDILNTPTEPELHEHRSSPANIEGALRFEDVDFRYAPDKPQVLRAVGFDAYPGEVVAIVGPSGSGKSTIGKLVQRLYPAERGRVLVDGVDVSHLSAPLLRRRIGVVLQDNVLFAGTIRENIALACRGMSMERVVAATKLAAAHRFIVDLPDGYETVVGEQGATLSGGQRQRIAIARALAADPRVLILDEATSALDPEAEAEIQVNLREFCRSRTVIVIAHRLSTVQDADRIVVLDRGEIVEVGTHAQLMAAGGTFARMHAAQHRDDAPGSPVGCKGER